MNNDLFSQHEEQPVAGYSKNFTGVLVDDDGNKRHFINGAYGREGDLPAVEYADGTKCWYIPNPKRGKFSQPNELPHRVGGPAVTRPNGDCFYYENGDLHRIDGPAVVRSDGTKKWFENGKCIRVELSPRA